MSSRHGSPISEKQLLDIDNSSPGRNKNRSRPAWSSSGRASLVVVTVFVLTSLWRLMSSLPHVSSAHDLALQHGDDASSSTLESLAQSVSENVADAWQSASESLFGASSSSSSLEEDDHHDNDNHKNGTKQSWTTVIPKPSHVRLAKDKKKRFVLNQYTKLVLVVDPSYETKNDNNSPNQKKPLLQTEAELLTETLRRGTGYQLSIVKAQQQSACPKNSICLELLSKTTAASTIRQQKKKSHASVLLHPEGYTLRVEPSHVHVRATSAKGVFYATQTILQLLPPSIYANQAIHFAKQHPIPNNKGYQRFSKPENPKSWALPSLLIHDAPRFAWRGSHLDVSRHFWPKEFVLKFIHLLALHKMNSFHWHLTDDQGWRLEIPKYPRLQTIAAWRNRTLIGPHSESPERKFDDTQHGGYYTQEDIREVVAFAKERHINIVPEIEMPGHTQSVLAAYPHLGCRPDLKYHVRQVWGVSNDVYCAGNERTFDFLEHVLKEVMKLFPHSQYIHVGGDECPKMRWMMCSKCQKRMKQLKLKSENQLQSYFMQRIGRFLKQHGRKMIGWDEILDGGLEDKNSTIMSWRGMDPGFRAIRAGHDAIMAPVGETYLDQYQSADTEKEPLAIGGHVPLDKVYRFDPTVPPLDSEFSHDREDDEDEEDDREHDDHDHHNHHHDSDHEEQKKQEGSGRILGAQVQLWSEYFPTTEHVEYMAFPRLSALAEALWMPKRDKNMVEQSFPDFYNRLICPKAGHLKRLEALQVNYRDPKKDSRNAEPIQLFPNKFESTDGQEAAEKDPASEQPIENDRRNEQPIQGERRTDRFHGMRVDLS